MLRTREPAFLFILCALLAVAPLRAETPDELRVKRANVFEFAQKPVVSRKGRTLTIQFTTRDFCDATVAVEDGEGNILRHLASGVLGDNAPKPFQKGSKAQSLTWDFKDDGGVYVDPARPLKVRVSLGLRPSFDKNLLWSPHRRHGREAPRMAVTPEGVYIYDGGDGLDFVELFDHDGGYKRTVYPFPADKIDEVKGLVMKEDPATGKALPYKPTFLNQTFLTSGNFYGYDYPAKYRVNAQQVDGDSHYGMYSHASKFIAVAKDRVALGMTYLARFATDGSSGGMTLEGPACSLIHKNKKGAECVAPRSAGFSPDGKTLYLTAYNWCEYKKASGDILLNEHWYSFNAVMKMDLAGDKPPEVFVGDPAFKAGKDDKHFDVPTSLSVDARGRVYVSDYMNDRIQVFDPSGKLVKSIPSKRPAVVSVDPKRGDIYVMRAHVYTRATRKTAEAVKGVLTVYGPVENPAKKAEYELPGNMGSGKATYLYSGTGQNEQMVVNGYGPKPRLWIAEEWTRENKMTRGKIGYHNVRIYELDEKAKKLNEVFDFAKEAREKIKRINPTAYARQRLYFNPASKRLYVGEGQAYVGKSVKDVIVVDPESGQVVIEQMPFDAEDLCFDQKGIAYLRTQNEIMRFDPAAKWREVPWDYGQEREKVFTSSSSDRREAKAISAVIIPANAGWHHDGMYVAPDGRMIIGGKYAMGEGESRAGTQSSTDQRKYQAQMYPGRIKPSSRSGPIFHIFDAHGELVASDVVKGIGDCYGVGLDEDANVYVMTAATRVWNGKPYHNKASGTMVKFTRDAARVVAIDKGIPIPLPEAEKPKRAADVVGAAQGRAWLEGAEWMYGGVGYSGKNYGVGCSCWNARFAFDYYARSFAPELDRYRVAVLDRAGNLMLRIGRYGNADSKDVTMMHGAYLATHTDHRLFIADPSNDRIISVKLDYHATERLDVPADGGV